MSLDVNISEPEEFNCNELHGCIEEVAKIKGIDNFEYHVDYICGKGENYIANVFRVSIKESGEEDNFSVIVKTLVNTARQELFHELHSREVIVYKEIIPKFKSIQNDEYKVIFPECLLSSTEIDNEVIVLEDMKVKGFDAEKKLHKYEVLDYAEVSLVIKELGKFHALSFIYQENEPEDLSKLKLHFQDILYRESFLNKSKIQDYIFESYEMSLKVITDLDAKIKLEGIKTSLFDILKMYTNPRKYNVFCHGDCWIRNMLFKYQDNEPTELCFLDFQAMRYASPVTDIIYFLYLCTDSNFRKEHFQALQNCYYDSLKSHLDLYNIDVNKVYPREDYASELEEMLPFGLLVALLELRIITSIDEDEAILKDVVIELDTTQAPLEVNLFKIRVNDVVDESVSNGVLVKLFGKVI